MKARILSTLALFLFFSGLSYGQTSGAGNPGFACAGAYLSTYYVDTTNNVSWACTSGGLWRSGSGYGSPATESLTCSAINYGQRYTDLTGNADYYCSASGWLGTTSQGTTSFTGANSLGALACNVNGYCQFIIQNTNAGSSASADLIVGNNNSTDTSYYGDFGVNSSGWTGVNLNGANSVYLYSQTSDLAIGTGLANAIHFDPNSILSPQVDAVNISTTGLTTIADLTVPAALAAVSGTPTGTPATTGGTVAAGANYAKIVAVDGGGNQTTVSTETALVTTSTATSTIAWAWSAVSGASYYQVWVGASSNGEARYFTSPTNSYTQTTPIASGTSGTMPTANATGQLVVSGTILNGTSGVAIAGVTGGGSAAAGNVGQVISSLVPIGSGVSIATSGTAVNMSSVSLTAGDWDVEGSVNFVAGSATIVAGALHEVGFNTSTASLPVDGSEIYVAAPILTTTSANFGTAVSKKIYNVSTTTTVYLVANGTFTAGTEKVYGTIVARRIR